VDSIPMKPQSAH